MFSFLLKETSCGSILVRDHLPLATTNLRILGGRFREFDCVFPVLRRRRLELVLVHEFRV